MSPNTRSSLAVPRVSPTVYRRRRLGVAWAMMAGLALFIVGGYGMAGASNGFSGRPDPSSAGRVHVVRAGETFWSIARSAHPHGEVRPLVAELARAYGPTLRVGARIEIP